MKSSSLLLLACQQISWYTLHKRQPNCPLVASSDTAPGRNTPQELSQNNCPNCPKCPKCPNHKLYYILTTLIQHNSHNNHIGDQSVKFKTIVRLRPEQTK